MLVYSSGIELPDFWDFCLDLYHVISNLRYKRKFRFVIIINRNKQSTQNNNYETIRYNYRYVRYCFCCRPPSSRRKPPKLPNSWRSEDVLNLPRWQQTYLRTLLIWKLLLTLWKEILWHRYHVWLWHKRCLQHTRSSVPWSFQKVLCWTL